MSARSAVWCGRSCGTASRGLRLARIGLTEAEDPPGSGTWARFSAPGRTGLGLQLPGAYRTGNAPDDALADYGVDADLTGTKRLWRGVSPAAVADRPGLLLSLAVLPPIASSGSPQVLPLVMVSDPDQGLAVYDAAPIGLALVLSTSVPVSGPNSSMAALKSVPTWEIVGWFGAGAGRCEVSSIADRPAGYKKGDENRTIIEISGPPLIERKEYSESGALIGGRWTEVALLVEGDRMVLYRDGRRVGEKTGAGVGSVTPAIEERVYVGVATLQAGNVTVAADASIDDVRLERLGDALAGTLPGGVVPNAERRVVCHPDGRVEVDVVINTGLEDVTTIELSSESGERAKLIVSTAGVVTSSTQAAP